MLIYSRVLGESAPEAFVLPEDDPTVSDLLQRVSAARSAQRRLIELDATGEPAGATKLRELGIGDGDLVAVRAIGEPRADPRPTKTTDVDLDALRTEHTGTRRLTEYEEATRLLQWHPPYHINGDSPSLKVWTDDSTELRCSDWESYRAPDKLYYRTYTTRQARAGRSAATAFQFAEDDRQLASVNPARVALLRDVLGALQYPDWGLCVVHQHTTRFALSSWIAGASSFVMFDELRHAQLYGRLALAYGGHHQGFDDPRPVWMNAPRFQPTRRIVEEMLATLDWGKAMVLADMVVEPLHTAAAHALLTAGSLAAGDALTPFVCRSIKDDKLRHAESAAAFLRLVCEDEAHGPANRRLITHWVAHLLPRAHHAASALLGVDGPPSTSLDEALTRIRAQLFAAGIDTTAMDVERTEVSA
jgi:Methane/Phenol/Toluene Hydroxylase